MNAFLRRAGARLVRGLDQVPGLRAHVRYALRVFIHKVYVLRYARRLGVPWLGVVHDISKLMPDEWGPKARYRASTVRVRTWELDLAIIHHVRRNKHDWRHWALLEEDGTVRCVPMPDRYRREMLADWIAAEDQKGAADVRGWYASHSEAIHLHPETRAWVEAALRNLEEASKRR